MILSSHESFKCSPQEGGLKEREIDGGKYTNAYIDRGETKNIKIRRKAAVGRCGSVRERSPTLWHLPWSLLRAPASLHRWPASMEVLGPNLMFGVLIIIPKTDNVMVTSRTTRLALSTRLAMCPRCLASGCAFSPLESPFDTQSTCPRPHRRRRR